MYTTLFKIHGNSMRSDMIIQNMDEDVKAERD